MPVPRWSATGPQTFVAEVGVDLAEMDALGQVDRSREVRQPIGPWFSVGARRDLTRRRDPIAVARSWWRAAGLDPQHAVLEPAPPRALARAMVEEAQLAALKELPSASALYERAADQFAEIVDPQGELLARLASGHPYALAAFDRLAEADPRHPLVTGDTDGSWAHWAGALDAARDAVTAPATGHAPTAVAPEVAVPPPTAAGSGRARRVLTAIGVIAVVIGFYALLGWGCTPSSA